ncbi:MAG: thiamine-phosphate kinase [Thermodesulfobacteriota bacterium]|nr:thiamine-phosphate kinase [Thermodesulfobacteriota bacterium]
MAAGPFSSEQAFLDLIDACFPTRHAHMLIGRGDDCALLAVPPALCLSHDLFLEHAHFKRDYFTPSDIGHKALAVNLSDLAGMGAKPLGFSLGLMAPQTLDRTFWKELLMGMAALAACYDLPLTGGDLSRAEAVGLSITVWGEPGVSGRVLRRQACLADDVLFLCGDIGLGRAGLMALEDKGREAMKIYPKAYEAHLRPEPKITEGLALAETNGVRGAMDVSDGLAQDLPRFLGPTLSADLEITESMLHPEVLAYCESAGLDPVEFAVLGGEDFCLLGAVSPEGWPGLVKKMPSACPIGKVRKEPDLRLNGKPFTLSGFDHFAS